MEHPPVVLGDQIEVSPRPIGAGALAEAVADPGAGATVVFLGTVRDHSPGKEGVTHLEYEAYQGVVERKIAELVEEARDKWPLRRVAVAHRVGHLEVGETSVGVAVSSAHRPEAFEGARYLIDELKARAPIWKKEHWPGGAEWVREDLSRPDLDPDS
ncbi:MAG: molybdenum cofactor biosynthesis protein MoaE [Actinomycetota bacterium]|nr:molybdenum cofactor biosynthesis protein MoaE [Actinomycetota bacterium]